MSDQAPVRGRSEGTGRSSPAVLWRAVVLLVAAAALLVACSPVEDSADSEAAAGPPPTTDDGTVTEPDDGAAAADGTVTYELRGQGAEPVTVTVEVAATPDERSVGLSNRSSVPEGTGMVFLFPDDDDGAFWMKDTLVPLSIAYVAADGTVVSVHEMTPCEADPCRVYEPAGPYRYALELPAGGFAAAGVGPGDSVVPLDPEALPDPR